MKQNNLVIDCVPVVNPPLEEANQGKRLKNRIEECSKSSMSQMEYSTCHKIPLSTFCYWKRKLEKVDTSKSVFYPLTVSAYQANTSGKKDRNLILHFQDGRFTIEIKEDFSPATLSKVITTLEQL